MPIGHVVTFSGWREPVKIDLLRAAIRKAGHSEEEFVLVLEGHR